MTTNTSSANMANDLSKGVLTEETAWLRSTRKCMFVFWQGLRTLGLLDCSGPVHWHAARRVAQLRHEQRKSSPYVFMSPSRYGRIQKVREQGKWTVQNGICPVNNFTRQWQDIFAPAGIEQGAFHDLRCTCLTRWFENGLSEYDVMELAGHSDFATTHRFYLAVRRDLLDRARRVSEATIRQDFSTHPYF